MSAFNAALIVTMRARVVFAIALQCLPIAGSGTAWAQQSSPASRPGPSAIPTPAPPDTPPPRSETPGLINELGKLWDSTASMLPSIKPSPGPTDPSPAAPPAAEPKPAEPAGSASGLAVPSIVTGRATCPTSVNGGPDCRTAATILCIGKGYKDGKSLAIDASEKCSAKLLIPGRPRQPHDCKTESFVTRALCQ